MTLQLMHLGLFSSEGEATQFSICHIQKHTKAQMHSEVRPSLPYHQYVNG